MTPKTALIVENDFTSQLNLTHFLRSMKYTVTVASTVKEASSVLAAASFDLIIGEIELPDGHIFDLHAIYNIPKTLIIFITKRESMPYMQESLRFKLAYFFVKPVAELTLEAAILRFEDNPLLRAPETIKVFGRHKNPINIPINEIEFIESEGNYSCIITSDNTKHVVKKSAVKLMRTINSSRFLRIQRSTFVNKSKLIRISFSTNKVFTKDHELLVSKTYKNNIYEFHNLDK